MTGWAGTGAWAQRAAVPSEWPGARLYGLYLSAELAHTRTGAADLAILVGLLADGRLDPQIGLPAPWTDAEQAIEALVGAVLPAKPSRR